MASVRWIAGPFAVLGLGLLLPTSLVAQSVRGTVTDPETGGPLWGAVVALLEGEEGESRVAGAIADEGGRFLIRAPALGTYRLRVERIGYRSTTSSPFRLGDDETATMNLSSSVQPVALREIRVAGKALCRGLGQGDADAYMLWEEARKALFATMITAGMEDYRFDAVLFRRRLDERRLRVEEEERRRAEGRGRHPFRSITAERLAEGGYVQETSEGTMYYAPDAQILLSTAFLNDHCFWVVEGEGEEEDGLLGLAFEPVPDRELPEVAGTLWVDAGSAELRRLDYRYENLDLPVRSERIGGRLAFERLPDGGWIVRSWRIRMPVVGLERHRSVRPLTGETVERERPHLAAFVDEGGELTEVRREGGELVRRYGHATLAGRVVDARGRPLSGAVVRLAGSPFRATAGADGGFLMDALPEGTYRITFLHPDLDLLGYEPQGETVLLEEGIRAEVRLALPPWEELVGTACEGRWAVEGEPGFEGVLVGRVRAHADGSPVPGAVVEIGWQSVRLERPAHLPGVRGRTVETRADSAGVYRVCGLPAGRTVTVRARSERRVGQPLTVTIPGDRCDPRDCGAPLAPPFEARAAARALLPPERFVRADLVLEAREARSRDAAGGGPEGLSARDPEAPSPGGVDARPARTAGLVVDAATDDRVSAARVGVADTVRVAAGAVPVEPISVTIVAERRRTDLDRTGFYERMARPGGVYITREQIEELRGTVVTDVLREVPGVEIIPVPGGYDIRIRGALPSVLERDCPVQYYVDGALFQTGPRLRPDQPGPPIDTALRLEQVAGSEIYRRASEIPARFRASRNARCGVIAVWTRGR